MNDPYIERCDQCHQAPAVVIVGKRRLCAGCAVPRIQCPQCHAISYHPSDIAHRYCGRCHMFHDQMRVSP